MSSHKQTIDTYNASAEALAEYFKGIGPRTEHIDRALELAGVQDGSARLVEIGCGDGRDAEVIIGKVQEYIGFDPSDSMLKLARKRLPAANFVLADSLSFNYPANLDVVLAFASFIHSDRQTNAQVFNKLAQAVRIGGIVMVNVRERDAYEEQLQPDQFGTRMYFYYTPKVILELAGLNFKQVYEDHAQIGQNTWLTMALERILV